MAEARSGEEDESLRENSGAARRNPRSSSAATERAERNKPEQRLSTQGALSSIRAAIKRTSTRTVPPEQNRERRRPEITIVAAEPLATNTWFQAASGAFSPPPPPPAQPSWTSRVTVQLPPPSYEQVIREKSREQNVSTSSVSASSSCSSLTSLPTTPRMTSTISTQTDTESADQQSHTKLPMRPPPKPPRPSLPLTPKPADPAPVYTQTLIELDDQPSSTHIPTQRPSSDILSEALSERSDKQTDASNVVDLASLNPLTPFLINSSQVTHSSSLQCQVKPEACPRPHPRSKTVLQPVIHNEVVAQETTRDVKVQTLVRLKDDAENIFDGFADTSSDCSSNKYLQELLAAFSCEEEGDQHDKSNTSAEEQVIISPVASQPMDPLIRPNPRPRTKPPKPSVLPKPSNLTQAVQVTKCTSEHDNQILSPPVPAPRPILNKSPTSQDRGNRTKLSRLPPPPRPPPAAIRSTTPTQTEEEPPAHRSAAVSFKDRGKYSSLDAPEKPVAITPPNRASRKCPAKPPLQRRPPTLSHAHSQDSVSAVSLCKVSTSGPSLPPRPSEGKLLPLRPPPIKINKSVESPQSPAPTSELPGYRVPKRGPPLPPRPKPGHPLYRDYMTHNCSVEVKSQHEDLVLDEVSSEQSQEPKEEPKEECQTDSNTSVRFVAQFEFEGEDGELSLCEGDVITLIEVVNEEWGRGSLKGRTGIFPLNFVQEVEKEPSPPRKSTPKPPAPHVCVGDGQTGTALYDFTPESENELFLKMGDVVCHLEDVDEEWFVGEFAGRRGIVPKNFIKALKDPKTLC
ncbi:SH3 domain-containing protein 19 isoform X2 [Trichomycterus rosablanca]|uniref:SH3 domain-containing protein 19 isoform X2 n=1 Tax=Trichomycterus rosablanca TaxID=2290929 RepID=UPI002F354636